LLNLNLPNYVNSPAGKSYFTNISNTTSRLNTISTNALKSCPIPLPPLSLQEEFAGVVARAVIELAG
jgi:type I restriction enzyme S subunit